MGEFFKNRKSELMSDIRNNNPDLKKNKEAKEKVDQAMQDFKSSWK